MKILWITNVPIADMSDKLSVNGGLWMDALLNDMIGGDDEFVIATSWNVDAVENYNINNIKYYLMPGGPAGQFKRNESTARSEWIQLLNNEKPDIIQLWGTENKHAIPVLKAADELNIPSVIYIQGLLKAIAYHADGHVDKNTMLRYTTLRDIYRHQKWYKQNKWFAERAKSEELLLSLANGVIIENKWAEKYCLSINPDLDLYKVPLSINEAFSKEKWSFEKMTPHTILCNASGYPYKGLHELIKALAIIKKKYPDVKLYVPGRSILTGSGLSRQKAPGYWVYVTDLINKNGLNGNVEFTGFLKQTELAKKLSEVNVFVLCSAIENHSSSLKEAMTVGTPAVASMVGGIPEYFRFYEEGFNYRYGEYETLAGYVCELFENTELCKRFSEKSKSKIAENYGMQIPDMIRSVYKKVKERCK